MPVSVLMPTHRENKTKSTIDTLASAIQLLGSGSDLYNKTLGPDAQKKELDLQAAQDSADQKQNFIDSGADSTMGDYKAAQLSGKITAADGPGKGIGELLVESEPYQRRQINGQDINSSDPRYEQAQPVVGPDGNFIPVSAEKRYFRSTSSDIADAKLAAAAELNKAKAGQTNIRIDGQNERYSNSAHDRNLVAMAKDKPLNDLLTTRNNLVNAAKTFEEGGRSPAEFAELQQAVRSNLGIKSGSGVHERQETYWKSMGLNAQKAEQILFGKPVDVMNSSPEAVNQVLGLVRIELENKNKQATGRLGQLKAGKRTFYGKKGNEGLSEDYDSAGQAYIDQFAAATPVAQPIAAPSEGPGIGERIKSFFGFGSPAAAPQADALKTAAQQEWIKRKGMGANLPGN